MYTARILSEPRPVWYSLISSSLGGNDFSRWENPALDELAQRIHASIGLVQQMDRGTHHFPQVVGDVRGHTHGNTGGAIEQDVGHSCRERRRFLQRSIEVGHPIHGSLPQLREQQLGIRA